MAARLDGHRWRAAHRDGHRWVAAHLVDQVGPLVDLVLLHLLVHLGLVAALGVLVLPGLQAHLLHHHPAEVTPIAVKVRDHLALMEMW